MSFLIGVELILQMEDMRYGFRPMSFLIGVERLLCIILFIISFRPMSFLIGVEPQIILINHNALKILFEFLILIINFIYYITNLCFCQVT